MRQRHQLVLLGSTSVTAAEEVVISGSWLKKEKQLFISFPGTTALLLGLLHTCVGVFEFFFLSLQSQNTNPV